MAISSLYEMDVLGTSGLHAPDEPQNRTKEVLVSPAVQEKHMTNEFFEKAAHLLIKLAQLLEEEEGNERPRLGIDPQTSETTEPEVKQHEEKFRKSLGG